jgi:hypothetical protein
VTVTVKNSNPEADKLKEFLAKDGKNVIREQLEKYIVALKEGKKFLRVIEFKSQVKLVYLLDSICNIAFSVSKVKLSP